MRREALDCVVPHPSRAATICAASSQVAKQLHESSPREPGLTANYARLALILEPNTDEAQRKAKEAYEAAPTDVNCVVTYAFALYGLGRTAQAIEILRTVPPEQLLEPHSAVYVAVMLPR